MNIKAVSGCDESTPDNSDPIVISSSFQEVQKVYLQEIFIEYQVPSENICRLGTTHYVDISGVYAYNMVQLNTWKRTTRLCTKCRLNEII